MDRRQFLATGGWAAAAPLLGHASGAHAGAQAPHGMFQQVDFTTDGLGLDPREYAALLGEAVSQRGIAPDSYSNGGLIERIEGTFARLLGKQAAMFVPTGTLANHLAVRTLAGKDRRVLVQAESHLFNDSGDCAEVLSGLNLVPLATGRSTIELAEIREWVERSASGRVATPVGVIALESPVRRRNHEMVDPAALEAISRYARDRGIRLHLDGARLFNLPLHSGRSVREYAALFDTVYVSLWKHFNGASGAILAGDAGFIEGLFHARRMFGGSLPYAWPSVALVEQYAERYEDDYARAWRAADRLIELLRSDGRFGVRKLPHGTSQFFLSVRGTAPDVMTRRVRKHGVVLPRAHPGSGEFALLVNATLLRRPPEALARILVDATGS